MNKYPHKLKAAIVSSEEILAEKHAYLLHLSLAVAVAVHESTNRIGSRMWPRHVILFPSHNAQPNSNAAQSFCVCTTYS